MRMPSSPSVGTDECREDSPCRNLRDPRSSTIIKSSAPSSISLASSSDVAFEMRAMSASPSSRVGFCPSQSSVGESDEAYWYLEIRYYL